MPIKVNFLIKIVARKIPQILVCLGTLVLLMGMTGQIILGELYNVNSNQVGGGMIVLGVLLYLFDRVAPRKVFA